jgi:hypothetical protein
MKLHQDLGGQAIQDVLKVHPQIGSILEKFDIGCVSCRVGICLLKDVVAIHALGEQVEAQIEQQINKYLASA